MGETMDQRIARLEETKKKLEAAGHQFSGFPIKCEKCGSLIGILAEDKDMNCPTCDIEYQDTVPHPPSVCAEHAGKEMRKAKKALDGALDQISKATKDREEIKDLITRVLKRSTGSKTAYVLTGDHEAVKRIFEWLAR